MQIATITSASRWPFTWRTNRGFFREEGFTSFDYDAKGLIPGSLEGEELALAIKKHRVDIVTAVDIIKQFISNYT